MAVAAIGVALTLLASYLSSWHVYDFDVVGYGRAQVKVGMWDIEACPERGDCEEMSRVSFERSLGQLSRASDADMSDWIESRWQVGVGLIVAASAAALLLGIIIAGQRYKVVRLAAAATFVVALAVMLLALRSMRAEAVDFMGYGMAAYLALFGLFDILLGAVLIGISRVGTDGPLPPAVLVRR
jgi:hypothetical protein